jgi:hypothetical protein
VTGDTPNGVMQTHETAHMKSLQRPEPVRRRVPPPPSASGTVVTHEVTDTVKRTDKATQKHAAALTLGVRGGDDGFTVFTRTRPSLRSTRRTLHPNAIMAAGQADKQATRCTLTPRAPRGSQPAPRTYLAPRHYSCALPSAVQCAEEARRVDLGLSTNPHGVGCQRSQRCAHERVSERERAGESGGGIERGT